MGTERAWRRYGGDAALAAGLAALVMADALLGATRLTVLDSVLLLAGTLVLAARRRAPRMVLLISLVLILAYGLRVGPGPISAAPLLIAIYTVVSAGHRVTALSAAVPLMAFVLASNLGRLPDGQWLPRSAQEAILPLGWFVAVIMLGEVTRHRRAYLRQVQDRAAEAERTREETALRRAGEERLRIARELHDSLTHSISVITVQAGVAVHLARKRGDEVPAALLAVQDAGRDAARELRDTLEVLRHADADGSPTGLGRLPELVERASAAGVPAVVTVDGRRRALPAAVDHAAYRIVQEALTNVARHAGSASASVCIAYRPEEIGVRVDDDGVALPGTAPEPGVGLTGMRERVTALGGRLRAEPRSEGGFTVEAEIPVVGTP